MRIPLLNLIPMAISLQRDFFESNQSYLRKIPSKLDRQTISPRNAARKGGLIINQSKYDLLVWFGSIPPADPDDWIVIPYRANCDISLFFTGEIHGFWLGDDNQIAKVYEFYGD
jgi:hypothetical protein